MKSFTHHEVVLTDPIRVLLVDDNKYFLEAACDLLQLNKAINVIDAVTTGQDAIDRAQQLKPDIILLDLNLEGYSGLDLIPRLKETYPQVKIIILTMMEEEPYQIASIQAGADNFLRKAEMSMAVAPLIIRLANHPANEGHPNAQCLPLGDLRGKESPK